MSLHNLQPPFPSNAIDGSAGGRVGGDDGGNDLVAAVGESVRVGCGDRLGYLVGGVIC